MAAWIAAAVLAPPHVLDWTPEMRQASVRMREAIEVVRRHHETAGIPIDPALDPNRTGLVGPEYSELFTTLGHLEAKRTTTAPDVAGLLVHLLQRAGVGAGDTVAVGASGSFPALLVATLCAVEALDAHPVTILSLGASSYGATYPGFDLLALHGLLVDRGIVGAPPAAVSLGGAGDVGLDLEPATRARLKERIRASGIPFLLEAELPRSVARRTAIYLGEESDAGSVPGGADASAAGEEEGAHGGRVAAFVNLGGADANVGVSPTVLSLRPGLADSIPLPPREQRGVLHAMAARGVPVVHLLDIRTLASLHRLPWDPVPLPEPGSRSLTRRPGRGGAAFFVIAGTWLVSLVILLASPVIIPGVLADLDPPEGIGR